MLKEDHQIQVLANSRHPAIIIHQGFVSYANQAFLNLLGYREDDIYSLSLLDISLDFDKNSLRAYLSQARRKSSGNPKINLTLLTCAQQPVPAAMRGRVIEFNGEDSVLCLFSVAEETKPSTLVAGSTQHEFDGAVSQSSQRSTKQSLRAAFAILLIAAIAVGFGAMIPQLKINNVPKVYLPSNSPALIADDGAREVFPSDQGMIFLFEGIALFSDSFLAALDDICKTLQNWDEIERVYSATNQDHISGSEDGFYVHPLLGINEIEELSEDERRLFAINDRFANGSLVSADGDALALVVIPAAIDDSFERLALQEKLHQLIRDRGIENYLSAEAGQITTDVEQTREFLTQLSVFVPIIFVLGLAMIWLMFQRVIAVITSIGAVSAVVIFSVALYSLFGIPFNLISSILPTLLTALTIAALVHLFNALQYAADRGLIGPERVKSASKHIQKPAIYNALTTMAGFASLGLSEIPPIKFLGLFTAAGVGCIYIVVYQLVPDILTRFDTKPWPSKPKKLRFLDTVVRWPTYLAVRNPVVTLLFCAIILGNASFIFIKEVVAETNLLEFFSEDHKTRVATQHIEDKLSGTGSLDIIIASDDPEGLTDPDSLNRIDQTQGWLNKQPEVDKSRSFADFVKEMNWGFHEQDSEFRAVPEDQNLITQYLFIYDGTDLYDFVDDNFQFSRISLGINIHGATEITALMTRIREHLSVELPDNLQWEIVGISRLFADQSELLVSGQVKSILGALLIILILMIMQWRSVKHSLICMLPNLSPVLMIFILMGALNIWLDVATAMIASVAVGIAIDDTIHLYHGFLHRIKNGISPAVAIARTYRNAGRAVMITTLILGTQFAILAFSDFIPIRNFGILTAIGMFSALTFDLVALPALMVVTNRKRAKQYRTNT